MIPSTNIVFFLFPVSFRSFHSTIDLLIVVSDAVVRAFNRSSDTVAVALDICKGFE